MFSIKITILIIISALTVVSCNNQGQKEESMRKEEKTAADILGNPDYLAISYGGYRTNTRETQPTLTELKNDMKILAAAGIKVLRTYNVQLPHATNVVKAIREIKQEDPSFEMYVMLGAWIDCKNAWTDVEPDHNRESEQNAEEIDRAVKLTNEYSDIIKVIAVGNEAMVKWATSYYVQPTVILKWVRHLQKLKKSGELPKDLWITSSDNFASWGGGGSEYHVPELNELITEVDFISMHTYPMHDTHYNPVFWGLTESDLLLPKEKQVEELMKRALGYAQSQYNSVKNYAENLGISKPIHIGETGWASVDANNHYYGNSGSKATDEYKEAIYYNLMREWTNSENISCFYFEAFDEPWKDPHNTKGSENHFGLFKLDGRAKYVLWDEVDAGTFDNLTRNGNQITKTYNGNLDSLLDEVLLPPTKPEIIVKYQPIQ